MYIMSKGPFTVRINKVVKTELFNVLDMTHVCNERKDELKMPLTVNISELPPKSIITYYLADDDLADEQMNRIERDERPVVMFSSDENGNPAKTGNFLWLAQGNLELQLKKLPRIVEILLGISAYYGKRRDIVEKSLEILKLTQEPETIDALFSMSAPRLCALFGEKIHPSAKPEVLPSMKEEMLCEAIIPLQIADALVSLYSMGADLEHPHRRSLRHMLVLALLHGESRKLIEEFIESYEGD